MSRIPLTAAIYVVLAAVACLFFAIAGGFPGPLSEGDVGPAAFPRTLAVALVGLIVIEWLVARQGWRAVPLRDIGLAAAVTAYTVGALLVMGWLGFYVVLPPVLFGGLWLLGERKIWRAAAFSLGFTAFVWGFFSYALDKPIAGFGA